VIHIDIDKNILSQTLQYPMIHEPAYFVALHYKQGWSMTD